MCSRTTMGRSPRPTRSRRAWTIRASGPSTPTTKSSGASSTRRQGRPHRGRGARRRERSGGAAVKRLAGVFAALRQRGARALIPYFTAGDPWLPVTRQLVVEAARRGADIIELGVPFSDPLADGPVIQRATQRALAAGVTLPRVLELVREMRGDVAAPLVFLTYYNPILAFGLKT